MTLYTLPPQLAGALGRAPEPVAGRRRDFRGRHLGGVGEGVRAMGAIGGVHGVEPDVEWAAGTATAVDATRRRGH